MKKSIVAFDTDRIKEYVFATDKLTEIRGASNILDELNRTEMPRLVETVNGMCVYAHGGSGLFVVATDQAELAIERVRAAYSQATGGAVTITGVTLPLAPDFDEQHSNIKTLWKHLGYKLAAAKTRNSEIRTSVTHPLLHFGDSDGTFYATHQDTNELISYPSYLKRRCNETLRSKHDEDGQRLPKDFDEIAESSSPHGYFALIYADGDGLGQAIETCDTLSEIQAFAKGIDTILKESVAFATKGIPSNQFDTLLCGGDDLVLAVPAQKALDIGLTITEKFKELSIQQLNKECTVSTAIVWAHKNFPFGAWLDVAESTLKFAKQQGAKRKLHGFANTNGLINFLVISSANHLDFKKFYNQVLYHTETEQRQVVRTLRPYRAADLRQLITYQQTLSSVSRSKLEALRRAVFQSSSQQATLDGLRVLVHWRGDETRNQIHHMPALFVRDTNDQPGQIMFPFAVLDNNAKGHGERVTTYSTPIADLIEIWDFIPGGANENSKD